MSIPLLFLKKIRCRLLDSKTDLPVAGAVVSLHAGLAEKGSRLPVGTLCSDKTGYVSFDLGPLIKLGINNVQELVLSSSRIPNGELNIGTLMLGNDAAEERSLTGLSVIGEVEASFTLPDALRVVFPIRLLDADSDSHSGCSSIALPAIQSPDLYDREVSPYSFVAPVRLNLGDGCCESLVPASLPVQQHRFYKVVVRRAESEIDTEVFNAPAIAEVDVTNALATRNPTIKFAEVLGFRQDWYSLGHSLGEIKYSLALAPGEATQIAIIDWSRQDTVTRADNTRSAEYLDHQQKVDRSIEETVDSALRESQGGSSFMAGTTGQATIPLQAVTMTFNHAIGASVSNSWGNRDLEAESLQTLHNGIRQQTGYTRSLNSTVVVQANQAEQNVLQTRRVANHNHCHALTIQYYEVLRHFRISTEFTGRTKAVLIPFAPFAFDVDKALQFRSILESALIDRSLKPAFDAALRSKYQTVIPVEEPQPTTTTRPKVTSKDTQVEGARGQGVGSELNVKAGDSIRIAASGTVNIGGVIGNVGPNGKGAAGNQNVIAPALIPFSLIFKIGTGGPWQQAGTITTAAADRDGEIILGINDETNWFHDNEHAFSVRVDVTTMETVTLPQDPEDQTEEEEDPAAGANTLEADALRTHKLIQHLNGNQGHYNSAIWMLQSAVDRRIRLEAALAAHPELLSGIDDIPIAVSGNYVAFPYDGPFPDWLAVRENDPVQALQDIVTLPTRGVFAEAQLGHCNACEERDPTRMSDWTEMTTEEPPAIGPIKQGPGGSTPNLTPQALPGNVISIAATPQAPDPVGLAAALKVMGTPEIFRNMSGLSEVGDLLEKLSAQSSDANIKALADQAKQKLEETRVEAAKGEKRTAASETDAGKQIDRLKTIEYAKDHGLIDEKQGTDAARGVLGGETTTGASGAEEAQDALGVSINLPRYCTPALRAFSPGSNSGQTTLRAVVYGAPAGSTWHWTVANPAGARFVAPNAYVTDVIAGDPGLTDVTFEARDPRGARLGTRTIKISVPQFVVIDEEAAAFDAELVAYHLQDVKSLVLQKVRQVVDNLVRRANVRTIWRLAPFNEPLPVHLAVGGFAAGKFNALTIRGTHPTDPAVAGTTANPAPTTFDEAINIYPGAFRQNTMDIAADVTAAVNRIAAMNLTDPNIKFIWIEIMARLMGENIAHEIFHALLGRWPGFGATGHNNPAVDFDILNSGSERNWLQRTAIEILDLANFPRPGSYRDGGVAAISSLQAGNQAKVDSVFPVPPALL
ncbi:MAG TPA: hypothetical protein VFU13_08085 [Steroidobacteraceae bacterium]|nr:hypothetical protein [Steroidobacteraceae bacterium]